MTSSIIHKHEKHAKLVHASYGEWGRNELAFLGTTCDDIKRLAKAIIQQFPSYKIAYVDADHKSDSISAANESIISKGAFAEYTNKISYTQLNLNTQPNAFQKRTLLNDCDLILVNGNHFSASKQIVVLDERKSLEKKLEKLTGVQMVLTKGLSLPIPDFLIRHIPNINELPLSSFDDTEAIAQYIKTYLQQQTPVINGLVLSGGQSTRMGRDKGNIHYRGKSQREYVFELLSTHCDATYISCNAKQSKEITDQSKIEDSFLNLGPLGGILSAFQYDPTAAWLIVACDLPFLNEDVIAYLIRHRNPSKMATTFWDAEGKFPEPLVTIWEPRAYPVLLQFLAQGYSCPRKVLINSDVEMLSAPDAFAFRNVNTAEEYEEALLLLRNEL